MTQSTQSKTLAYGLSARYLARLGWLLSGVVVLVLAADSAVSLAAPSLIEADMAATGFPASLAPVLGVMILVSVLLYAIPRTAVLGAILVTAFLGGAISIHFRLGEIGSAPQIVSVVLAVLAWGGLYLRDARLRALLPFVSAKSREGTEA